MSSSVTSHYCIASDVYFHRLDEEIVVYSAASFETHLIDDAGGQILESVQQIQDSATLCTVPVLYAWLWTNADFGPDILAELEAEAVLIPLLDELVRVGILAIQVC